MDKPKNHLHSHYWHFSDAEQNRIKQQILQQKDQLPKENKITRYQSKILDALTKQTEKEFKKAHKHFVDSHLSTNKSSPTHTTDKCNKMVKFNIQIQVPEEEIRLKECDAYEYWAERNLLDPISKTLKNCFNDVDVSPLSFVTRPEKD